MFSLLVDYAGWPPGHGTIARDRLFERTDEAVKARLLVGRQLDRDALSRLPALFMTEVDGSGSQMARVGSIHRIEESGREVRIEYQFDDLIGAIPNEVIESLAGELGIVESEVRRTHWAVKDRDLFRVLLRHRLPHRRKPRVFDLDESESTDAGLIAVMMPFGAEFDPVIEGLRGLAEEDGLRCERADDIWNKDAVIDDIVSLINRARVVICDCTDRNPNVFYEAGIAHSLGRHVILITQSESDIPFNLRHLRFVKYLNNAEGRAGLIDAVQSRIQDLVER